MADTAAVRLAPAFRILPRPRHTRARTPTVRGASRRFRPVPRATATSSDPSSSTEPFTLGLRRDAEDALVLGEPIGRGAMGVVRSCTRRSDGCRFALKTIPKAGPTSLEGSTPTGDAMSIWERKVRDEVNLHFALGASLDIVTLHDAFEDEAGVHLLIDLCDGGDLLTGTSNENEDGDDDEEEESNESDSSSNATNDPNNNTSSSKRKKESWKPFTEAAAATTIRAMLRALAACHAHGVVHRDVKPANFLYLLEPDGSRRAKLSDFGLAARINTTGPDGYLTERCGTYAYLSPEMARRRPYDFKVDAWAAGVVAYMLLAGEPPFADWDAINDGRDPTREGLLRAIRRGRPVVPVDDLPLSPGAKSLLRSLLEPNPEKRMSCAAAAEHYWVRERGAASHADALASTVVEKLQAYGTLGAVRRACLRAAFEEAEKESFFGDANALDAGSDIIRKGRDASNRLIKAVDDAAARACEAHAEECDVSNMWGDSFDGIENDETDPGGSEATSKTSPPKKGVSAEALALALRDHGAELAPEEWLSLIRPFAARNKEKAENAKEKAKSGAFVRNAALAAALAAPLGGSFAETERRAASGSEENETEERTNADELLAYDWTAVAAASFRRLIAKDPLRGTKNRDSESSISSSDDSLYDGSESDTGDLSTATVTFDAVADEVCAWDDSEELCRATLREEFDAADADGDGRLGINEWTDLVWSEGLMDGTGRVKSTCGADAPAHDPEGPKNAGVGNPGCDLAPEDSVRRPPTDLSPREKARAAAEARRKMAAARRNKKRQ